MPGYVVPVRFQVIETKIPRRTTKLGRLVDGVYNTVQTQFDMTTRSLQEPPAARPRAQRDAHGTAAQARVLRWSRSTPDRRNAPRRWKERICRGLAPVGAADELYLQVARRSTKRRQDPMQVCLAFMSLEQHRYRPAIFRSRFPVKTFSSGSSAARVASVVHADDRNAWCTQHPQLLERGRAAVVQGGGSELIPVAVSLDYSA